MLIKDIINENLQLNETLSKIVFHFSPLPAAANILKTGNFELASSLGSIEQQYAPKNYPYFMSTTRTKHGGYHSNTTSGYPGVLFVLDGNWFNNRYPSKAIDYWENRNPKSSRDRHHEAEDRVFSKEPKIPIDGVISVHVFVPPDDTPNKKAWARQIMLNSKLRKIPAYYYTNKRDWENLDIRKSQPISSLKGQEHVSGYRLTHKGYMRPWIELMFQPDKNSLSDRAKKLIYNMGIDYYRKDIVKELLNDLSNSRKPNSGPDRENSIKLIKYMRDNKLEKVSDLVDHLHNKWKNQP